MYSVLSVFVTWNKEPLAGGWRCPPDWKRILYRLDQYVVVVVYFILFSQSNKIQDNIILYNIQNRNTEKVQVETKMLIYSYPKLISNKSVNEYQIKKK